ncbi:alaserpin-like [Copidosoma floridanum]|uniref:alaserpin-like n=1 Tax=Copidosoma floridanum TaxID=29053 RepID=UPI0006C9BAFD|nr:alaserpin-like [Copidosoma floridanum]
MASKEKTTSVEVTKGAEKFITNFHKSLAGKESGNFVSSGLSAHMVMAMAAYGADGSSAQQMRKNLHLPEDDADAHLGFQSLVDMMNETQQVDLKVANKIYVADDLGIKDDFRNITDTYFRSKSETIDFKMGVESAKAINGWCVEKTNGKIKKIVNSDDLDNTVEMILLNAVYFKGDWLHKFDPQWKENKSFHIDKDTIINLPMMYVCKQFFYKELDGVDAKVIALPYMNKDFHMVIIVPNKIDGLEKLEKNLEKVNFDSWCSTDVTRVRVSLPKFKIESTLDLKDHLIELGISNVFTNQANFKGICDKKVRIDKVIQKAFIEINEEGSEAAAVTVMTLSARSISFSPPPVELPVDRPFLFKIMYNNMTLFSGHIMNLLN